MPIDEPAPLAKAILTLATDKALRLRMGAEARRLAETRFSSARIGQQTSDLYLAMARNS